MEELEIELPITNAGNFDFDLMKAWADFQDQLDQTEAELGKLL